MVSILGATLLLVIFLVRGAVVERGQVLVTGLTISSTGRELAAFEVLNVVRLVSENPWAVFTDMRTPIVSGNPRALFTKMCNAFASQADRWCWHPWAQVASVGAV